MYLSKILKATLVLLCLFFLGFQIMKLEVEAAGARAAMVLLLTLLYVVSIKSKRQSFFLFLIFFLLGEIFNFASYFVEIDRQKTVDYFYYLSNGLFILSYVCLIVRVLTDMDIKNVLKKFWIHFMILIVLDIFCVMILSDTTEKRLAGFEFTLELFYNTVIMLLLTFAMINYMSKNTLKSMNFLLGAIFIFFSEVIQMTYFYVSDIHILNVMCSFFLVLAFLFLYLQARITYESEQQAIQKDIRI